MEKPREFGKELRLLPNLKFEQRAIQAGYQIIAGVDEAGRGPTAGPVVIAAVVLGPNWNLSHPVNDSKKLSAAQRERLFDIIRREAQAYRIVAVSQRVIDQINILQATLQGMKRAVEELRIDPDYLLIDGNQYPPVTCPGETVVRGDALSLSIAAASILAKTARDRVMLGYARLYPQWGFEQHKGYPTKAHRNAVEKHGLSPIHRRSFRHSKPQ